MLIKRGDVFYADLDPIIGSEQGGIRPVLVVQNNVGNKYSPTVVVLPISSAKKNNMPTHILLPLHDLKLRRFSSNSNVMEIHKEIAKLKEQTHVLARLKTKGFLDNAKYLEQTSELNTKVKKLQSELKKITYIDDEDETLNQIEMLIDYFERSENPISEFDPSAFESIVEKIVVINQNELEFHVIGGLKFTEKIC